MAKKEYKQDNPVTMASEPAVAYRTSTAVQVQTSRPQSPCQYMEEDVMVTDMETMDVEELRAMLHETVRKEYAMP